MANPKSNFDIGENEVYDIFEIRRKILVNYEYASSLNSIKSFWNTLNNIALYNILLRKYVENSSEIDEEIKRLRNQYFKLIEAATATQIRDYWLDIEKLFGKIEDARKESGICMTVEITDEVGR